MESKETNGTEKQINNEIDLSKRLKEMKRFRENIMNETKDLNVVNDHFRAKIENMRLQREFYEESKLQQEFEDKFKTEKIKEEAEKESLIIKPDSGIIIP